MKMIDRHRLGMMVAAHSLSSRSATDWQPFAGIMGRDTTQPRAEKPWPYPLAAQSAGDFSDARAVARTRPALHSADPAPRRRILLAATSSPGRHARPCA